LGQYPSERHTWQDLINHFIVSGATSVLGALTVLVVVIVVITQGHPKGGLVTPSSRMVCRRRAGPGRVGILTRLTLKLHRYIVALALLPELSIKQRRVGWPTVAHWWYGEVPRDGGGLPDGMYIAAGCGIIIQEYIN